MLQIYKNYRQYIVLPPNCVPRGNLLSIAMYIISSFFRLLTVTHGQGSMCIKNYALFMNKHHPKEEGLHQDPERFTESEG